MGSLRGPLRLSVSIPKGTNTKASILLCFSIGWGLFMKEFKTLDEQIDLLKSRGLIIHDEDKAKRYLLTNNYYNIINGYSKPFMKNGRYIPNTDFDKIAKLYFFDKEIKQTFFRAIISAEYHLKSIVSYRFAEEYKNSGRYSYLDINSYDQQKILSSSYVISRLFNIIKSNANKNENPIEHYVNKYNDVPIWVIAGYLNFSELEELIKNSPKKLQNKIAKDLVGFIVDNNKEFQGQFPPEIMMSFIKNIHEVRNICAHNKRLLYFKCRQDMRSFGVLNSGLKQSEDRRSVYSVLLALQCFLSETEFKILNNTLMKRMKYLQKALDDSDVDGNDIFMILGFPKDWHKQEPMQQN